MAETDDIRQRIDRAYASLRPAERAVARLVHGDPMSAGRLTVGQLADAAHVSQPTVIRFARKIGFGGYRELRYALRHPEADSPAESGPLAGLGLDPWDEPDRIPQKAVAGTTRLLEDLGRALDGRAFRRTCSLLASARFTDIYGVEDSLTPAIDLSVKLSYLGLTCRLATDAYLRRIGAGHLGQGDVALAFSHSGSSEDTVGALRAAKTAGAHTVAVTGRAGSPLTDAADVVLLTGTGEQEIHGDAIFSRVADVALVDMLYMGVILSDYGRFSAVLDGSARMVRDRDLSR